MRKHWGLLLGTVGLSVAGTALYTLRQPKIYQASATVQLDPHPPRPLGKQFETVVDMGSSTYWSNREYFETQYKIAQSMRVALEVVRRLDLSHDPSFVQNIPLGARVRSLPSPSVEQTAELLRRRLTVEPVKDSRLMVVRLEDAVPERAQRVLTTLVDVYIEQNLEGALTSTTSAADWLRDQLEKLKGELDASEMALHTYKLEKNMLSVAFDDQSNMLREQMKQINEALTRARTEREEIAARREELRKVKAEDPSVLPARELLQSTLLQTLRQRFEEANRDRDALVGGGKGKNHPEVLAAEEKVAAGQRALLAEVKNIQGALDRDLAVLDRQVGGLSGLLENAKKQALDLNLLDIEYNRLHRTKVNNEKLYALVLEKTKESDLTRMLRVNNLSVVDRALVAPLPVRPRVPLNLGLGLLGGLALGSLLALLRTRMDRSLKTPDQVEQELGLTFLGLLPEMEGNTTTPAAYGRKRRRAAKVEGSRELIVHEHPTSGLAEAARAIRTNLMFMAPDRPFRTLLVTSSGPSDGKTTVACCIATAMAQAGQRVLLVDCDMRRPRMHRIFGKSNAVGVTSALLDASVVTDELVSTQVPNLFLLPSGPIPPNPAELIHTDRFRALLEELGTRFDRIVIDSPPVVAVTDATILSTLVEATVLVVRAFKTSRDIARQATRSLRDVGGRTAGVVLNAVDLGRHEYGQYHYYYYKRDGGYAPLEGDNPSGTPAAS